METRIKNFLKEIELLQKGSKTLVTRNIVTVGLEDGVPNTHTQSHKIKKILLEIKNVVKIHVSF